MFVGYGWLKRPKWSSASVFQVKFWLGWGDVNAFWPETRVKNKNDKNQVWKTEFAVEVSREISNKKCFRYFIRQFWTSWNEPNSFFTRYRKPSFLAASQTEPPKKECEDCEGCKGCRVIAVIGPPNCLIRGFKFLVIPSEVKDLSYCCREFLRIRMLYLKWCFA